MIQIKVVKMHCGGCAKAITRAIHGLDPKARVEVDLASATVAITPDVDLAMERFTDAIRAAGYGAELTSIAA